MYYGEEASAKKYGTGTKAFPITTRIYQGFGQSHYQLALVMDELTKHI